MAGDNDFIGAACIFHDGWAFQKQDISSVSSMTALTKNDLRIQADLSDDADRIVNRTAHFIGDWIDEHVVAKPAIMQVGPDAAEDLACLCIADAKAEGIAGDDIQGEVGDLKEYIADAIVEDGTSPDSVVGGGPGR